MSVTAIATKSVRDPFAAKLAQSQANVAAREAAAQAKIQAAEEARLERLKVDRLAAEAAAAQAKAERHANAPRTFGHGFLEAVADRVMNPDWHPDYFLQVQEYARGMLSSKIDPVLPQINPRHAKAILEKFRYGLGLAKKLDRPVPDGLFYGQRLLAQMAEDEAREARAKAEAKQAALVIRKGARPRGPRQATVVGSNVDLKPAITPAGAKKKVKKG